MDRNMYVFLSMWVGNIAQQDPDTFIPSPPSLSNCRNKEPFFATVNMALMPPPSAILIVLIFVAFMSHEVSGQPDASQRKPISLPHLCLSNVW